LSPEEYFVVLFVSKSVGNEGQITAGIGKVRRKSKAHLRDRLDILDNWCKMYPRMWGCGNN
jgi:hypothetical protein